MPCRAVSPFFTSYSAVRRVVLNNCTVRWRVDLGFGLCVVCISVFENRSVGCGVVLLIYHV